jgi:hypothetical protein
VGALGDLGPAAAAAGGALEPLRRDSSEWVRMRAEDALRRITGEVKQ